MSTHAILDPTTYVVPEVINSKTVVSVDAERIYKGDAYLGSEVTEVKVGRKWVYVTVEGRKSPYEVNVGTQVEVERLQENEASTKARYRARTNQRITEDLASRTEGVKKALAKVTQDIESHGYSDSFSMANLIAAQSELRVQNELVGIAMTEGLQGDLVDAFQMFIERLKERLVQDTYNRALSRSTSVVSNLLEDSDREAVARFIYQAKWIHFGL